MMAPFTNFNYILCKSHDVNYLLISVGRGSHFLSFVRCNFSVIWRFLCTK